MAGSTKTEIDLFAAVRATSGFGTLLKRLGKGGALHCRGVARGAQPFLTVLLRQAFPDRPIVAVTEGVKAQELFHQDVETWLSVLHGKPPEGSGRPMFYPAWEVLPHEDKLPHVDVVSERLETLVRLGLKEASPLVVTNVLALMQRTYRPEAVQSRMRVVKAGDQIDPLDLVEWLEDQGYEPEARVNHKGEIALRGGILDLFPLISPWPVRIEFFGNEIESVRYFDPATQISTETIERVTIAPAGELGILKQMGKVAGAGESCGLLEHVPAGSLVLLLEPELIEEHVARQFQNNPGGGAFLLSWEEVLEQLGRNAVVRVEETLTHAAGPDGAVDLGLEGLDGFRPIMERAPQPEVAEQQRRAFFDQLHRWLRRGDAVEVFCNNEGERQRFGEIWEE